MTVRWSMRPSTYDRMMRGSNQRRYFENSGYFNFGYWGAGAKSQREASEALVDQMVARIANRTGRILDVACGLGGSTKRLTQTFLKEAYRVLKPGGSLAMSDMLFPITILSEFGQVPRANLLPSIAEYCARLAAAGFVSVEVTDATGHCLGGFRAHLVRWAGAERRAGRMKLSRSLAAAVICKLLAAFFAWSCKTYLLVSARKPS